MARYVFRLEQLLELRRRERDAARQRFAIEMKTLQQIRERRTGLEAEQLQQQLEIGTLSAEGHLDVSRLVRRRAWVASLGEQLRGIDHEQLQAEAAVARQRAALTEAERNVRLLERLREKQQIEFDAEQQKHAAHEREEAWLNKHIGDSLP